MSYINKSDRIFVAGHKGMAGSSICRALKKNGYLNESKGGKLLYTSKEELNLLDAKRVDEWFESQKPTIVVLAAAKVGGILANSSYPVDFYLENIKIQNNVIESSFKHKVRRLLFLGSSCIYPKFASQPIREEELLKGELEETNEAYALAKISGIKLCTFLKKQYNFDAISLMPTNLYGQGDNYHPTNSHVVPAFIDRFHTYACNNKKIIECWGSGNPKREFMHVDDLADACLFALKNWDPKGKDSPLDEFGEPLTWLNVGTGNDISIKKLANMISKLTSFKGEIHWDKTKPDGTFKKLLDISKLNKLGWESKISLSDGLNSTYREYKKDLLKNNLRTK